MTSRVLGLVALVVALALLQTGCKKPKQLDSLPTATPQHVAATQTPSSTQRDVVLTQPPTATATPRRPAERGADERALEGADVPLARTPLPTETLSLAETKPPPITPVETAISPTATVAATKRVWWPTATPLPTVTEAPKDPYPAPPTDVPTDIPPTSVPPTSEPYPGPTEPPATATAEPYPAPPTDTPVPPTLLPIRRCFSPEAMRYPPLHGGYLASQRMMAADHGTSGPQTMGDWCPKLCGSATDKLRRRFSSLTVSTTLPAPIRTVLRGLLAMGYLLRGVDTIAES